MQPKSGGSYTLWPVVHTELMDYKLKSIKPQEVFNPSPRPRQPRQPRGGGKDRTRMDHSATPSFTAPRTTAKGDLDLVTCAASPPQVIALQKKGAILIDVREEPQYNKVLRRAAAVFPPRSQTTCAEVSVFRGS